MRFTGHLLLLFSTCALPAVSADAEGCRDFKMLPKVDACAIVECDTKIHDSVSFQLGDDQEKTLDGASARVKYLCPASIPADRVSKDMAVTFRKAGFSIVYEDHEDPMGAIVTGKNGARWAEMFASNEDEGTVYTLTTVDGGPTAMVAAEACSDLGVYAFPKGCSISECTAKKREAVGFRTNTAEQYEVRGPSRATTVSCDPKQVTRDAMFDAAKSGLKDGGFQILFDERIKPDYSWLTGKSASRWVELMSFHDGNGIAFQVTSVQSIGTGPAAAAMTPRTSVPAKPSK